MKIYDETTGAELSAPDLEAGYLYAARRIVAHHEATEAVTHLEVMPGTESLNGGAGLRHVVVDTPARPEWDEYEDCQYYHAYTAEELAAMQPAEPEPATPQGSDAASWAELAAAYSEGVAQA